MSTTHKLGWSTGVLYEEDDGTVTFRAPGHFLESFRVRIKDVTGFTETKGGKKSMQNTLHIMGPGGEIASCDINVGTSAKIEAWFRAHPDFGASSRTAGQGAAGGLSVADELTKLAGLRDAGILTPAEFEK